MRRPTSRLISLRAAKHAIYIPRIISSVRNWLPFLINYIGLRDTAETYILRNGSEIRTEEGADSTTIAVVFVKRDYGRVDNDAVVIDIGANIGVFAVYAATTAVNTTVYAYEPMPSAFNVLLDNIARNQLEDRIIPVQLGVASERVRRKLYQGSTSQFGSIYPTDDKNPYVEVDCVSLADILEDHKISHCDLLKVDCEGAEFEILYNTPSHYLARIRKIRMEYHNHATDEEQTLDPLLSFLRERGFELRKIKEVSPKSGTVWLERVN